MDMDILKGKMSQLSGSLKEKFGEFTDDELQELSGEREKFVGKVQEKYGLAKEEAEKRVDEFLAEMKK